MGAVYLQFAAFEQTLSQNPSQPAASASVSLDANDAQVNPAPQDTVTLTGQAEQGQQANQSQQQFEFQQAAMSAAQAPAFMNTNGASGQNVAPMPTLPVLLPGPAQPQTAVANNFAPAVSNSGGNLNASAANAATVAAATNAVAADNPNAADPTTPAAGNLTPQQELSQLDSSLQELGIDPQSIPLFNRISMLLYANDPAALRMLVQQMQSQVQQIDQGTAASANPGATQNSTSEPQQIYTQTQSMDAANAPPQSQTASAQVDAAPAAFEATVARLTVPQGPPPSMSGSAAAGPAQSSAPASQFAGLQIAVAALQRGSSPTGASSQGLALNVSA